MFENGETFLEQLEELKKKVSEMEKYKAFFENAPLSYQSLNEEGIILDINPTWLKTLGYCREEVIGKKFSDFLHPNCKKYFLDIFSAFMKKDHEHDVIFRIRQKEGTYIEISFERKTVQNIKEGFKQSYCIFHDITERKKDKEELIAVAESEQNLADIIRLSPVAVAFGYPDGKLALANKAFEDLTGYSETELKEIKWDEVLTPEKWREMEFEKLGRLAPQNNYVRYEKEYIHKSGKVVPVELNVTAKFNEKGELIHFIGFLTDITERKMVEKEIEMHRKNLEQLIEERTKELQDKNRELDRTLKVFVGREMLIKELQKKIKDLGGKT